jgi:hypothetical protein
MPKSYLSQVQDGEPLSHMIYPVDYYLKGYTEGRKLRIGLPGSYPLPSKTGPKKGLIYRRHLLLFWQQKTLWSKITG